jgi:hypothetical protein
LLYFEIKPKGISPPSCFIQSWTSRLCLQDWSLISKFSKLVLE